MKEATRGQAPTSSSTWSAATISAAISLAAAPEGRIVQISTLAGPKTQIDLRQIMQKRLTLTGSTLRNRPVAFKAELARALEETVWPMIAQGRYKPVIDKIFPLEDVVEAHRAHRRRRAHRQDHPDDDGVTANDPSP